MTQMGASCEPRQQGRIQGNGEKMKEWIKTEIQCPALTVARGPSTAELTVIECSLSKFPGSKYNLLDLGEFCTVHVVLRTRNSWRTGILGT